MRRIIAALALAVTANVAAAQLPESSLAVRVGGEWRIWWTSAAAPSQWDRPDSILSSAVGWRRVNSGIDRAELRLSGNGEAWRIRVILVRVNPVRVRSGLVRMTTDGGTRGAWTVDSIPRSAILAVNAGQFSSGRPWGWIVRNGIEEQPPGFGPLSLAFIAMKDGSLRLISSDSIASYRERVSDAFQSYPTLLESGGRVPLELRAPDHGVDLEHRDSRVAICQLRDGRMMIALTRFEGLGGVLSQLPFGPTAPEMSAVMGALGCSSAVSLDGGISGQLALRERDGFRFWRGMRRVPLGLVFLPQ